MHSRHGTGLKGIVVHEWKHLGSWLLFGGIRELSKVSVRAVLQQDCARRRQAPLIGLKTHGALWQGSGAAPG